MTRTTTDDAGQLDPMRFWSRLGQTNPEYTKKFQRPGGFQGTDISPQHRWQKLTEVLGPAGTCWGTKDESFRQVDLPDGQVMIFVTLRIWYRDDEGSIQPGYSETPLGAGGDFIVKKFKNGNIQADDEGYKKALTDAIGNAARFLGVGADVYLGLFDDSKYVDQRQAEEQAKKQGQGQGQGQDQAQNGRGRTGRAAKGHGAANGGEEGPADRAMRQIREAIQAAQAPTDLQPLKQKGGLIAKHYKALPPEYQQEVQRLYQTREAELTELAS